MKKSEQYRQYAEDCLRLASTALDDPQQNRYRRMADAWRALAEEEQWLEDRRETSKKMNFVVSGTSFDGCPAQPASCV